MSLNKAHQLQSEEEKYTIQYLMKNKNKTLSTRKKQDHAKAIICPTAVYTEKLKMPSMY